MIRVEHLCLTQGRFALKEIGFEVPTGHYAVMTGQTGSGKTTLLEAIAGLRQPRSARITLDGRDVTGISAAARGIGYVPQDAAIFKTMTVAENLSFALRIRGEDSHRRAGELADWLGLRQLLNRKADTLSGGEAQRVALGRALAARPSVLLFDEPLSSLDDETREGLVTVLDDLRRQRVATILHVTHLRAEAERLADLRLRLIDGQVEVRP